MRPFYARCCLIAALLLPSGGILACEDVIQTDQENEETAPSPASETPVKLCEHSDVTTEIIVMTENGAVKKRIYRCPSLTPTKPDPTGSDEQT